jgi:hypothetical protein
MTPDAVPPPPPNRFWTRRGETAAGARIPPAVQRVALFLFAVLIVLTGLAYKAGWFPFDDRSPLRAELKADVIERSKLPIESVEITGDGMAVATLADEKLAVRWARDGTALRSVCQRPRAETEAWLRAKAAERYGPVKALAIRPSPVGVGYVGEVELESGEILDVVETTDLAEMWAYQDFWQSPKSYPVFAKRLLTNAVKAEVTEVSGPVEYPAPAAAGTERLYSARMRAGGVVYAVELFVDRPAGEKPKGVWEQVKLRYRQLGP